MKLVFKKKIKAKKLILPCKKNMLKAAKNKKGL